VIDIIDEIIVIICKFDDVVMVCECFIKKFDFSEL
jgi:hypothetical protein